MAELAISAIAALGTSAAAGGAAAGSIGAGLAASTTITTAAGVTTSLAAGATSGLLGGLGTALSVGSAAASILGGFAAFRQSELQADVAELNAEAARTDAAEKSFRIRREMVQKVGAARVAFGASGVDISSAGAIEGGFRDEADFESLLARNGGEIAAASGRLSASALRTRGVASLADAAAKVGSTFAQNSISIARRG